MPYNKAVKLHDLQNIKADVQMAEFALKAAQESNNWDLFCQSGYHLGQAAEKCLKSIIRVERKDIWSEVSDTHDITFLMQKAEVARSGIIKSHPYLAENSERLSKFNSLRYGLRSITVTELKQLMTAVKSFVEELERDFLREHPDAEQNKQDAKHEWDSRPRTELRIPPPPSAAVRKTGIEQEVEQQQERNKERHNSSYGRSGGQSRFQKQHKPYQKHGGSYGKNHGKPKKHGKEHY